MTDEKNGNVISLEDFKSERYKKWLRQFQEIEANRKGIRAWIDTVIADSGLEQGTHESRIQVFARAIGIPYRDLMKIIQEKAKRFESRFPKGK